MGFERGLEKNNLLENGIRTPLHDPLYIKKIKPNLNVQADSIRAKLIVSLVIFVTALIVYCPS